MKKYKIMVAMVSFFLVMMAMPCKAGYLIHIEERTFVGELNGEVIFLRTDPDNPMTDMVKKVLLESPYHYRERIKGQVWPKNAVADIACYVTILHARGDIAKVKCVETGGFDEDNQAQGGSFKLVAGANNSLLEATIVNARDARRLLRRR